MHTGQRAVKPAHEGIPPPPRLRATLSLQKALSLGKTKTKKPPKTSRKPTLSKADETQS